MLPYLVNFTQNILLHATISQASVTSCNTTKHTIQKIISVDFLLGLFQISVVEEISKKYKIREVYREPHGNVDGVHMAELTPDDVHRRCNVSDNKSQDKLDQLDTRHDQRYALWNTHQPRGLDHVVRVHHRVYEIVHCAVIVCWATLDG